jgi:hypothetical protein
MKSYTYASKFSNLRFSALNFVKKNQVKIIIIGLVALLALITGVFSAAKYMRGETSIIFSDFGLKEFVKGNSGTSTMFFQRMWSICAVMLLLTLLSMNSMLFSLGIIVIVYRGFLLGLNVTFIIVLHGIGGIITGLIIIFPFQLLMLALMIWFYITARDRCITKSKYGTKSGINLFLLAMLFLLALTLVNLIETILLVLTSAKVILII